MPCDVPKVHGWCQFCERQAVQPDADVCENHVGICEGEDGCNRPGTMYAEGASGPYLTCSLHWPYTRVSQPLATALSEGERRGAIA